MHTFLRERTYKLSTKNNPTQGPYFRQSWDTWSTFQWYFNCCFTCFVRFRYVWNRKYWASLWHWPRFCWILQWKVRACRSYQRESRLAGWNLQPYRLGTSCSQKGIFFHYLAWLLWSMCFLLQWRQKFFESKYIYLKVFYLPCCICVLFAVSVYIFVVWGCY